MMTGIRSFMRTDAVSSTPMQSNRGQTQRYGTNGNGIIPLDSLVRNPDATWLNAPFLRLDGSNNRVDPNNPDSTGFGQIIGLLKETASLAGFC